MNRTCKIKFTDSQGGKIVGASIGKLAFTVDVEDWVQASIDSSLPITDAVCRATQRTLEILSEARVTATFFVLGRVAEAYPAIVRQIRDQGHEVQSHGFSHIVTQKLGPRKFRDDVMRSKETIEDITGAPVRGYRAPAHSLFPGTLWALDVLLDAGFAYDASLFPVRTRRYGMDTGPTSASYIQTPAGRWILEFPVTHLQMQRRIAMGGGGQFRIAPAILIRKSMQQSIREGRFAAVYVHPHEFLPLDLSACERLPGPIRIFHQWLGRSGMPKKIRRLLREFPFCSIDQVLSGLQAIPSYRLVASRDGGARYELQESIDGKFASAFASTLSHASHPPAPRQSLAAPGLSRSKAAPDGESIDHERGLQNEIRPASSNNPSGFRHLHG